MMKTTSSYINPYHSPAAEADNEAGALVTLREGINHELEEFVALELTAETMIEDEAFLVGAYISDDADHANGFWHDLKDEIVMWEMSAGRLLLTAADPTRTEWHRGGWFNADNEPDLH